MRTVFAQTSIMLSGLAALIGCAKPALPPPSPVPAVIVSAEEETETEWRNFAKPEDITRIEHLREYWKAGLAAVRPGKAKREIEALGALLDPTVALPRPAPPPGQYRCRVLRLPESARVSRGFISYKPFSCHVGGDETLLTFTKQSGSERPAGRIWPDGDTQLVFLGAMAKDDEETPPAYGDDASRNLVGVVERVEDFRWRMVLPRPVRESRLDVIELVPLVPGMVGETPS